VTDYQARNFSSPGRFFFHPHREASGRHAKIVSVCCVARPVACRATVLRIYRKSRTLPSWNHWPMSSALMSLADFLGSTICCSFSAHSGYDFSQNREGAESLFFQKLLVLFRLKQYKTRDLAEKTVKNNDDANSIP